MSLFALIYCTSVCLLSGYIGGYHLDEQMKAIQTRFIFVDIPEKLRRLFWFNPLYTNTVLLLALIIESSGILFAFLILLSSIALPVQQPMLSFAFLMMHCIILVSVGIVTSVKFLISVIKNTDDRRLLKCEIRKLLFAKSVICSVEIIETPDMRVDGMFLVKYGTILPRKLRADKSGEGHFYIGSRCYAIYRDKAPHFIILSNCSESHFQGP